MTPATLKALRIIDSITITHASQFGRLMWPDSRSDGHKLSGGCYLGKLSKRGLIRLRWISNDVSEWRLTDTGKELTGVCK